VLIIACELLLPSSLSVQYDVRRSAEILLVAVAGSLSREMMLYRFDGYLGPPL